MSRLLLVFVPCLVICPHLIPWDPLGSANRMGFVEFEDDGKALPETERMAALAEKEPVAFLEACLRRYSREVKTYTVTMQKQERIKGNLEKKEVIAVSFREDPFSVFFNWKEGARMAARALYVEGENKDEKTRRSQALIKPAGIGSRLFKSVLRDPEGADAQRSGRYPISEFGLKIALERTLNAWKSAKEADALHVEYLGKKKLESLAGRECYVLKRTRFAKPEADGITAQTVYIDVETWLMTGSILKGDDGKLIAEYFFRDVRLNVEFDRDLFTKKSVEN